MIGEPGFGYEQGHAVADDLASDAMMRRDPYMTREFGSARQDSQIRRAPSSAGLYEVLDLILDKGIVIDAFVRVSLVGIELLTVDLRVVIASVDTYLRYAEGVERLQVYNRSKEKKLPDMVGSAKKGSALKKGAEKVGKALTENGKQDDEDQDGQDDGIAGSLKRGVRNIVGKLTGGDEDESDESDSGERHRSERQMAKHSDESRTPQKHGARR